ncbi:MAG: hypothetical protein MIN69_05755 [Methylorubrum extorquens]|jgi:DNA anti-recombination protein RmuC|uniref:hypothetical protein n=1 Tax=Methylorubrum extorquens TaxID=408 RepID=UPI002FEDF9A9
MDDLVRRVATLEENAKEVRSLLKEIRDGQQAAAVKAAEEAGGLKEKFADVKTGFSGVDTKFADIGGKLNTMNEISVGLRRDLDKLPSKYDVALIMVAVVGGLSAVAGLLKVVWPALSKLFS